MLATPGSCAFLVDPEKPDGNWTWLQVDGHRWTLQLKPQLPAIALNMADLRNKDCLAVFTACPFHGTNLALEPSIHQLRPTKMAGPSLTP